MHYYNIVYCRHADKPKRRFVFEVPLDVSIGKGDVLLVDTAQGEAMAIATSNNICLPDYEAKQIAENAGAYFPLKRVLRRAVARMEEIPWPPEPALDDDRLPF